MRHRPLSSRLFRAGTALLLACAWLACLNPRPEEWPSNAGTDDTSTSGPQGNLNDGTSGGTATSGGEGGGSGSEVPVVNGSAGTSAESPGDAGPADAAPDAAHASSLTLPAPDAGISNQEPRD